MLNDNMNDLESHNHSSLKIKVMITGDDRYSTEHSVENGGQKSSVSTDTTSQLTLEDVNT